MRARTGGGGGGASVGQRKLKEKLWNGGRSARAASVVTVDRGRKARSRRRLAGEVLSVSPRGWRAVLAGRRSHGSGRWAGPAGAGGEKGGAWPEVLCGRAWGGDMVGRRGSCVGWGSWAASLGISVVFFCGFGA